MDSISNWSALWSKAVVTPDDDSAYMDAVKRGDMETARRMVREAAAKAMPNTKVVDKDGLPLVVYHGTTHGGHTIFNGEKNASYSYSVRGVTFFSSSRDVGESYSTNPKTKFADLPKSLIEKAKSYLDENNVEVRQESDGFHSYLDGHHIANSTGKTKDDSMRKASISVASSMEKDEGSMVYSAFVNISNPLVYDFGGELWKGKRSNDGYYDNSVPLLAKRAMANGYDGLIVRNVEDAANIIGRGVADDYAVFSPSQIKSADITYDDAGKLIPLSERFNPQKDDIRWSKEIASNENGNGNSDADNFKRWFADSKIVNSDGEPLVVYRGASYNPTRQPEGKGVVKPEAYFTADREYASRYGETEPYYLRIERPFDVRNPKDAAVLKSLLPNGYDFATGKSGALDWGEMASFDTEDIKALGYDGIVLDEGGDKQPDGGTKYRGVSFVPLYGGAQVKSATKNNGDYSESPDVRWSKAIADGDRNAIEEFDRKNPSMFGAKRIWLSAQDFARIQHQKPSYLVGKNRYYDDRDLFPGYVHHLNPDTGDVTTDVYACEYQGDEMFVPYNMTTIAGDNDNDIMSAYEKIRDMPAESLRGKERSAANSSGNMGIPAGQRRETAGNGGLSSREGFGKGRASNGEDDGTVNGSAGSGELDVGLRWSKAATESIPQDVRDEIRGITQDRINYYREKVGLPPLESKHRTLSEMEREGQGLFANRDLVNTIVDAVSKKPRSLSEEETIAIGLAHTEANQQYDVKMAEVNEAMLRNNKADEARLRAEADAILSRVDKIDHALRDTGSVAGRVLNLRRIMINRDLTLAGFTGQCQALKGKPLTDEEKADIAAAYKAVRDAISGKDGIVLRELTKRIRDAATSDVTEIVNEIKRLGRKSVPTDVDGKFKNAVKQHLDGATMEELELMSPVF